MKLFEKQFIFAQNVSALIHEIVKQNYACTLGEVYRTKEQAEWYVKQKMGILNSLHCKKLAIDIQLFDKDGTYLTDNKSYEQFGEFWENLHTANRWGGNFSKMQDSGHFQMNDE